MSGSGKVKVICVDAYDREGPGRDDSLVCMAASEFWAEEIVKVLNCNNGGDPNFYKAVDVSYKLKEFEP